MGYDPRPRGIRNHNPGNLRPGVPYLGIVGKDFDPRLGEYLIFGDDLHGIRAIASCLVHWARHEGIDTIGKLVKKYAPPEDRNPTNAYIGNVCAATGFTADEPINLASPEALAKIIPPIIHQEVGSNGGQPWFSDDLIRKAIAMVVA